MTKITLGGRELAIEPLKLGQLRGLLDALDDLSGKTGGAVVDAAARVIQAGLARAMPDLTLAEVLEFEATMDEVTAAVATILGAAGLSRANGAPPGEAAPVAKREGRAPAETANGSPRSTPPSPPAAPTRSPSSTA
jgi:hypothetical protein